MLAAIGAPTAVLHAAVWLRKYRWFVTSLADFACLGLYLPKPL